MKTLITLRFLADLIFLAGWAWLLWHSRSETSRARTVPELLVRILEDWAQRLNALASGLANGIIAYREMRGELPPTRAERHRELAGRALYRPEAS